MPDKISGIKQKIAIRLSRNRSRAQIIKESVISTVGSGNPGADNFGQLIQDQVCLYST